MTTFSRRQFTSILINAFLWTGLVLLCIFVPVRAAVEEPVYKEIRIQLAPLSEKAVEPALAPEPEPQVEPVVETAPPVIEEIAAVETPAPSPAPAPKPAPAPAPAPVPAPAPAPAAKAPVPEPAKQTLVKSVDQLMAEQAASRGTKKNASEVDWDAMFGESSTATSAVSTGEKTFAAQTGPSISGSSASSASDAGTAVSASSGKAVETTASAGTASALSSIADAASTGAAGGSSRGSAAGIQEGNGTGSSAGESSSVFGDGMAGRKLVRPSKPEINLTDDEKTQITASVRDIRISFKVRKDGTVLRESIMIDKKASLPAQISQEIERQISEWFFETGTSDGQAVFLYSIIKE